MGKLSDKKIIDSWEKNASPWIVAVQTNQIESRKLVTNKAIVDCVMKFSRETVLDIGCGEGWLAHTLIDQGLNVFGIDVVSELIEEARKKRGGLFDVLAYEDVSTLTINRKFDTIVCNFSLLGKESVDKLFKVIPSLLNKGGYIIVQTPHPAFGCGELPYMDGWRQGSWSGFSSEFSDPAPWYFRTIESWLALFQNNNFRMLQFSEPLVQSTGKAASLIMVGRLNPVDN